MTHEAFSARVLELDPEHTCDGIVTRLRDQVRNQLRRRGVVLGVSGGIDSSVAMALAARAFGVERVLGLLMPEVDTSGETTRLGRVAADAFGVRYVVEDIGPILEALGCYRRRDDAIRLALPEYGPGYRSKIVRSTLADHQTYSIFWLVAEDPAGNEHRVRLGAEAYLGIVAATNFKQRTRKMFEYYYADSHQYAVAGTPNRLEYDQGFFVKNGDGAADVKPIAHLYKSQVYQLATFLGVPEEIRRRPPTTDTYSLPQSQDEFYFALPYDKLDLCLYAWNHGIPAAEVASVAGLSESQVDWVFRDIVSKRKATRYLHLSPLLIEDLPELGA